jgi:hypothetical protein
VKLLLDAVRSLNYYRVANLRFRHPAEMDQLFHRMGWNGVSKK